MMNVLVLCLVLFAVTNTLAQQNSTCRLGQWQCRDGNCIRLRDKCNGVVDCPDRSDETFPLCRKTICPLSSFRCVYGACVDKQASCNDIQECADNSDELLPICRNDPDYNICEARKIEDRSAGPSREIDCFNSKEECDDGQKIFNSKRCDGKVDCADGSDETLASCANTRCSSPLFTCAYGGCAHEKAECDGVKDCADGSDESDELCNRNLPVPTSKQPGADSCVLPPYPENGRYVVGGKPSAKPGEFYDAVQINVTCNPGYGVPGNDNIFCYKGFWSDDVPKCILFCKLEEDVSVEYHCLKNDKSVNGTRPCTSFEPTGTMVQAVCRAPNYYSPVVLPPMNCVDGKWDYVAKCQIECGRVTPAGEQLVVGGRHATRGELPWHVGVYRKGPQFYTQICGGTILSATVVISAAHCFWSDVNKLLPASDYAVAAGKLYRPWKAKLDPEPQRRNVKDIKIPPRFQGEATNYQDDLAILQLEVPFEFKVTVRPVCLDFDFEFNQRQLMDGSYGKVAGWGRTSVNGSWSALLKVIDLPFVNEEKCIKDSPISFVEYITPDKFCAGFKDGEAVCQGDSGGGFVFSTTERGTVRFYLRGVISTSPTDANNCKLNPISTFTQITKHEQFIKNYL